MGDSFTAAYNQALTKRKDEQKKNDNDFASAYTQALEQRRAAAAAAPKTDPLMDAARESVSGTQPRSYKTVAELDPATATPGDYMAAIAREQADFYGNNPVSNAIADSRVFKTAAGAVDTANAGYVNAAGTLNDYFNQYYAAPTVFNSDGTVNWEASVRKHQENPNEIVQNAVNAAHAKADELNERGAQRIAEAKDGLGWVGRTLVDAGVSGVQMLGDAALNAIVPGAGLTALGVRAFGNAAQDARQKGADVARQMGYGAAVGAVEVISEKLFDGLAGAYGEGMADSFTGMILDKLGKSDLGKKALEVLGSSGRRVLESFGDEAIEEIFSGVVDPALESIIDNQNPFSKEHYNLDTLADIGTSALIGGILGGLGGAVEITRGPAVNAAKAAAEEYDAVRPTNNAINYAYEQMAKNGMFSQQGRQATEIAKEAVRQQQDLARGKFGSQSSALPTPDEYEDAAELRSGRLFSNMGDEAVRAIVDEGLESAPGTDSRQLAEDYSKRLKAGDKLTDNEIGRLYRANQNAISEEAWQAGQSVRDYSTERAATEADLLETYAQDDGMGKVGTEAMKGLYKLTQPQGGNVLNFYAGYRAVYNAAVEGRSLDSVNVKAAENLSPYARQQAYEAGLADAEAEQKPLAVQEQERYSYSITENDGEYAVTIHDAETGTDMSGGTFAERSEADAAVNEFKAQMGGATVNEQNRAEGPERASGVPSGRRSSGIRERAEKTAAWREARKRDAENIRNSVNAAEGGEKVSAASRGIKGGTDNATMHVVTKYEDDATRRIKSKFRDRGIDVVFFTGEIEAVKGGKTIKARGTYSGDGKTFYVCLDDPDFTAEQIADHEDFHARVHSDAELQTVAKQIIEGHSAAELREMVNAYVNAYGWTNMSDYDIMQEILADAYAGIDVFLRKDYYEGATRFTGDVRSAVAQRESEQQQTRGPPAEQKQSEIMEDETREEGRNGGTFHQGNQRAGNRQDERGRNRENGQGSVSELSFRSLNRRSQGQVRREVLTALGADYWKAHGYIQTYGVDGFVERVYDAIAEGKELKTLRSDFPDLYDAVVRGMLGGFDLSAGDGKARWTPERISNLYKQYGAEKSGSQDYAKGYAAMMRPSDFLALTATSEDVTAIEIDTATKDRYNHGRLDQEVLRKVDAPRLYVNLKNGQVENHEGRHRMSLLSNEGIDSVPVVIVPYTQTESEKYHTEKIPELTLKGQTWAYGTAPGNVVVNDVTPFSNRYRAEVEERFGGEAQVSFSEKIASPEEIPSGPVSPVAETQYSMKFDDDYMEAAEKVNDKTKNVPESVMSQARKDRETIKKYLSNIADMLPPDIEGNTFYSDSSYGGSEENSTVCVRSLAYEEFMDAIAEQLGRPLTVEDTVFISQEAMTLTDKPECLYCYVAMDRKAYREYLGKYIEQRDAFLKDVKDGMEVGLVEPLKKGKGVNRKLATDTAYGKFLANRDNTENMYNRVKMWMDSDKLITKKHLASIASMNKAALDPALRAQIEDAQAYAQAASWAKKKNGYAAYNNHILKWSTRKVNKLNKAYGLRLYSFSDYSPAFILENMQMLTDASVKGLKALAYTKELDFARIFAPTGANINISVFGYNDGGGVAMDAMQGADWEQAKALRNQYPNVGCTFVATNDAQVEWALAQDWIDVVIPFHIVRTGANVASMFGWSNYTDMSEDRKNPDWKKGDKKHIFPSEHQNDKAAYLELCEENHLTPRFEKWVDNPNYMKLVNETRQSEAETQPVQPVFDISVAEQSIDEMVKRGGYMQHIGGTSENMQELAKEVAGKIESRETQFSQKLTEEERLGRQNDQLRDRVEYWKGQTKRTKTPTARQTDVNKQTKDLLKSYDSKADAAEIGAEIKALTEYVMRGGDELNWPQVKEWAVDIARDVIDEAEALREGDYGTYKDIKASLQRPMVISAEDAHDVSPEWGDWRNSNRKNVNVSINGKGTPVDTIYAEMADSYPSLFPKDITHPADQLLHMTDVLRELEPVFENPFSSDMADAIEYCANDIIDRVLGEDIRQTPATFADKAAARLAKEKARGAEKAAAVREQKNAQIAKIQAENAEATKAALAKEKAAQQKKYDALKQHYADVKKAAAERKADSKARSNLLKIARRLNNRKLPAVSRALLDQYIGDLDLVAKSITGQKLDDLRVMRDWYEDQVANNPDFLSDPATEERIKRLSKKRISDMTAEEVAELTEVLLNFENEVRTQKQLIDSEDRRDTYLQGAETIEDVKATKGSKGRAIDKLILTETLSPTREMRRITGYNDNDPLYQRTQELADGQRKMFDYQRRAGEKFRKFLDDKKFIDKLAGKNAQWIEIRGYGADGKPTTAQITPAMRMSLYLHSLNDQNMKHIRDGGITIPDQALYKKGKIADAYAKGETIKLTPSAVRSIAAKMTAEERAFANAAHDYFNGMSRNEINAVSEKLKGYSLAGVEDYFPINTDTAFTKKDFEALKFDGTLEGMGFLKERVNAKNPIMLRDMNDVLTQSINQHSKYVGLAIPVRNFNKVWGVTTQSFNEDGTRNSFESSVQKAISQKWGKDAVDYVEKMMTDLQNAGGRTENWDKLFNKVRSNYAQAVLTLNLSVAMKQAASYPTAAAVTGWKPLARAMADFGKVNQDLIAKYTPLQWYRSQGYSSQELGDMAKRGMKLPPILNWVQGIDLLTTRKLWKASEYYVRQNNKALTAGSDEYYKAVADVYNRVIEETQPNYTTMQRPQLLRSDSTMLQNLAMFKTQPFQNFNVLYDAFGNLEAKRRAYLNAGRDTKAKAQTAYHDAQKRAAWAVSSQVVSLAVFAAMTFAWARLRGKDDKYRDDEGNLTLGTAAGGIGKDMLSGSMGMVPFGTEVYDVIASKVFGDKYYGMDAVTPSAISDVATKLLQASKTLDGAFEGIANGEPVDWNEMRLKLEPVIDSVSKLYGIPEENVKNLFNMVYRQTATRSAGEYAGEYAYLRLTASPSSKSGEYYDNLYKAYQNSPDEYREILQDMIGSGDFAEDKIKSAMESRMKKSQGVSKVDELDQRWMAPEQQEKYDAVMNVVGKTGLYRKANDKQIDALEDAVYDYVMGNKSGEATSDKISGGKSVGLDSKEYFEYLLALSIADQPNSSGKLGTYNNEEQEAAIRMVPGLSDKERSYLWMLNHTSDKNNPYGEAPAETKEEAKEETKEETKTETKKKSTRKETADVSGSSAIKAATYDPKTETVSVTWAGNGRTYEYEGVSAEDWESFKSAPSKGSYVNQHWK